MKAVLEVIEEDLVDVAVQDDRPVRTEVLSDWVQLRDRGRRQEGREQDQDEDHGLHSTSEHPSPDDPDSVQEAGRIHREEDREPEREATIEREDYREADGEVYRDPPCADSRVQEAVEDRGVRGLRRVVDERPERKQRVAGEDEDRGEGEDLPGLRRDLIGDDPVPEIHEPLPSLERGLHSVQVTMNAAIPLAG